MTIVRLMGGLGNQMFQYAAGLRLAMRHSKILKLDLSFLLDRTPRENFAFRDFDLVIFDLPEEEATQSEARRFRRLAGPKRLVHLAGRLTNRTYYLESTTDFSTQR
jgi:hypothetical protein